mmetsp:Transcript_540/g.2092  ORF Transcript_540/g.2092 Transcript_540/m.2092 type:complete len:232 (-) Transcript_540:1352-2047(-)
MKIGRLSPAPSVDGDHVRGRIRRRVVHPVGNQKHGARQVQPTPSLPRRRWRVERVPVLIESLHRARAVDCHGAQQRRARRQLVAGYFRSCGVEPVGEVLTQQRHSARGERRGHRRPAFFHRPARVSRAGQVCAVDGVSRRDQVRFDAPVERRPAGGKLREVFVQGRHRVLHELLPRHRQSGIGLVVQDRLQQLPVFQGDAEHGNRRIRGGTVRRHKKRRAVHVPDGHEARP